MSHLANPIASSVDAAGRRLPRQLLRNLVAAATVAAAAAPLATALQPAAGPAPSAPMAAPVSGASWTAAGSGSVPDAATVFRGRELVPEGLPPTF